MRSRRDSIEGLSIGGNEVDNTEDDKARGDGSKNLVAVLNAGPAVAPPQSLPAAVSAPLSSKGLPCRSFPGA
jgi:hypothetical protein